MNRSEAEALGVEALELANSGAWGELLAMELPGQVLELVRQKAQLNRQVEHLEEQDGYRNKGWRGESEWLKH